MTADEIRKLFCSPSKDSRFSRFPVSTGEIDPGARVWKVSLSSTPSTLVFPEAVLLTMQHASVDLLCAQPASGSPQWFMFGTAQSPEAPATSTHENRDDSKPQELSSGGRYGFIPRSLVVPIAPPPADEFDWNDFGFRP